MIRSSIIAVLAVILAAPAAHAADSCTAPCPKNPKETRSVSAVNVPRPAFPAPLLTATLAKALRKRVLKVDAMMTTSMYTPGFPRTLALLPTANGIAMQPSLARPVIVDCGGGAGVPLGPPSDSRTVAGSWWLDIDDPANAALPGPPPPPRVLMLRRARR